MQINQSINTLSHGVSAQPATQDSTATTLFILPEPTEKTAAGTPTAATLTPTMQHDTMSAMLADQEEKSDTKIEEPAKPSARDEFLEWMNMSWAERFVAAALHRRGLTQEDFEALPVEEQDKIMEEIREEMREIIKNKTEMEGAGIPAIGHSAAQNGPSDEAASAAIEAESEALLGLL